MRRKRCPYCRGLSVPDPRVGSRQKVCRGNECQARRKKESQRNWSERHGDYWDFYQVKDESRKAFRRRRLPICGIIDGSIPSMSNETMNGGETGGETAPKQAEKGCAVIKTSIVQTKQIKRLIVELLPCRNQDEICL